MFSEPAGALRHEAVMADDGVVIGYPVSHAKAGPLVLGAGARLRTGTVLYHGSTIGRRLQTGHGGRVSTPRPRRGRAAAS